MPKIRCHYLDCIFLDERYCSAAAVEINPEHGCLTYSPNEESEAKSWDDDEDLDDWDEMNTDEDAEDLWNGEDEEEDDTDLDEQDQDEY